MRPNFIEPHQSGKRMSNVSILQPPDHTLYPRYTGIPSFMWVPQ